MNTLGLILGSVVGGLSRYGLSSLFFTSPQVKWPVGTFAVNLIGCFLIGIFAFAGNGKISMNEGLRLLFITGFCGAFTTFSTFIFEIVGLTKSGQWTGALTYGILSIGGGLLFYYLGAGTGKSLF